MTILFEEHGNHNCIQSLKIELAIVQKVQKENQEKNEEQEEKMLAILAILAIVEKKNKEKNEEQEEKISKMQSELDLLKAEIDALKKVIKEKQPASSDLQLLSTVGQSQAVNQVILYFSIQFSLFTTHLLQKEGETPLRWSNKKNINKYKTNQHQETIK